MRRNLRTPVRAVVALLVTVLAMATLVVAGGSSASAAVPRLTLRALVVDDGTPWAQAMQDQFTAEGVPFTKVSLSDGNRPQVTAAFLATGTTANFNAVVVPSDVTGLGAAEEAALASFEQTFGVRQIDMYNFANPTIGLNYAQAPGYVGDLTGMTGTVTPAAAADGFSYLKGSVPIGVGSYGYLATPAGTGVMPAGGTFTPLVTVPIPGTTSVGSLVGVYSNAGVEKLVITAAMSSSLSHFRAIAHGLVTWVTRGVHFGYNRNYVTFHFDDAFSADARWSTADNCTPTEDCPSTVTTTTPDIRMVPNDVTNVVNWQTANNYTLTLPFNAYRSSFDADGNALTTADPLTTALVANRAAFRWLNHGYQHIFQGCVQDFTVTPWKCTTTDGQPVAANGSNISWISTADISSEITTNITRGTALGLPFDKSEYLSGEHSGLYRLPQQPVDNPNFATALTANAIKYIGADASREPGARVVGSATTVPRHPVAVYYNVSTAAEEVDEYNYFYNTRANGGSGYCEDNPATATCLAAPLTAADFASYIVPTDAANDLRFILSNDPRPFYAHVSNLTGPDYIGLTLVGQILTQYRSIMADSAPPVNLTLTQASDALTKQQNWQTAGMGANPGVTGYIENGKVTVTNPTTTAAPLTLPSNATVNGAAFGAAYGGERSAWVAGSTTATVPTVSFTSAATANFALNTAGTFAVTTTSADGVPALTVAGTLPAGLTFTDNGNGTATLAGTPTAGGTTPLTITATTTRSVVTQTLAVNVSAAPAFTSATTALATIGKAFTFTVATSGYPAATVTSTGTLPAGLTFQAGTTPGTGIISGTPTATATTKDYPLTFKAVNTIGTATQAFVLTVGKVPAITSTATGTATVGSAFSKGITTTGYPAPTLTVTGLPNGLTYKAGTTAGTGTISGTPAAGSGGSYPVTVTATNTSGTATQTVTLAVRQGPAFTSASTLTAARGVAISFTVATSGYPVADLTRWTLLPAGLVWKDNNNGTATISGTATRAGTTNVTLSANNALGLVFQTLSIRIT